MVDGSEEGRPSLDELELELEAERAQSRLAAEALRELRQSEARKGAILEAALDCIVSVDHEGKITEWNPAAARTFGYARVEAMGRSLAELLVPPSLREQHIEGFRRYLETGQG